MHKSNALRALVIIVPLLILCFAAVLLLLEQRITALQAQQTTLEGANAQLRADNLFYKRAYELTLDDIQTLSRAYAGTDARYLRLAAEFRQKELGTVLGEQLNRSTYSLRNPRLWQEYQAQGVINVSCLPLPVEVDTITEEVLLTLGMSGEGGVQLYIDGNFLETLAVNGTGQQGVSVDIPQGTHELTLIAKAPGVKVDTFLMDTTPVSLDAAVIDGGSGWAVFDCRDASVSTTFSKPGAMRLPFKKR